MINPCPRMVAGRSKLRQCTNTFQTPKHTLALWNSYKLGSFSTSGLGEGLDVRGGDGVQGGLRLLQGGLSCLQILLRLLLGDRPSRPLDWTREGRGGGVRRTRGRRGGGCCRRIHSTTLFQQKGGHNPKKKPAGTDWLFLLQDEYRRVNRVNRVVFHKSIM